MTIIVKYLLLHSKYSTKRKKKTRNAYIASIETGTHKKNEN